MIIKFKKGRNGDILECIRTDGSNTWTKVRPGLMAHELLHYAVETQFQFKNAFFGLLSAGHGIEEFETERANRKIELIPANLPEEAQLTEVVVGVMQTELVHKIENIGEVMRKTFIDRGMNTDKLNEFDFEKVRSRFDDLIKQWRQLEPGDQLEMAF